MPKNFKCERCGECCRSPRLSRIDISRIRKLCYDENVFAEKFPVGFYMKEKNGWCIFLEKGKKALCKIYNARPRICRLYPSELINGSCKPEKLASDRLFE